MPREAQDPMSSDEKADRPMATAALPQATDGPVSQPSPVGAIGRRRGGGEGHGRRLTAAFEALEVFPALAESRNRLFALASGDAPALGDVIDAVESDIALVVAVLRAANETAAGRRSRVESVVEAVKLLPPATLGDLAGRVRTFDFFERTAVWDGAPERFRLHGLATRTAAARLAAEVGYDHHDRLMVTALLHDIGKLVLLHAYSGYPGEVHRDARTPEERVHNERRELGVDHGLVGGVLARRWGLPKSIASAIERHHSDDASDEAALVRIADMLAHYANGGAVSPAEMLKVSRNLGIGAHKLRAVMFDLPQGGGGVDRPRTVEPCPLSSREMDVLKRLAEGKVYKQIAHDLGLSTSTVRTHLHNVYGKLGAVDRARAVLIATEHGWLST